MSNYVARYLGGEYRQVWQELIDLGTGIQHEPVHSEALAVARETMKRARINVETLVQRLHDMGYRFINPAPLAGPTNRQELDDFEKIAPLPLSIRAWYELVGEVDFGGSHPTLAHSTSHAYFRVKDKPPHYVPYPIPDRFRNTPEERRRDPYKDRFYSQPFAIYPFNEAVWEILNGYAVTKTITYPYQLELCLDFIQQAGESGSGTSWIEVPGPTADALLIDTEHLGTASPRKIWFVDYLREVFQWGGFPGYAWYSHPDYLKHDWGTPPMNDIGHLAEGLLPI
jgi:hypothetical protein